MTLQTQLLILAGVAYVVGSIPFGLLIGLWRGRDPRDFGSGNIGATNVGRMLGRRYFALVFALDLLKGAVPMLVASYLVHQHGRPHPYLLWMLVGAGAVLGHLYSIFLRFAGGKGVATSAGVLVGLWPYYTWPGVGSLIAYLIGWRVARTVSVGSIAAAATFPLFFVVIGLWENWPIFGRQLPLLLFAILMGGLIIWKHRSNIRRLLDGTEETYDKSKETV